MNAPRIFEFDRRNEDARIPDQLWCVTPPLRGLWVQGREEALELLQRLPEEGLAIVGTRLPQFRSLALLRASLRDLSALPKTILSGLARGIDSAAHEAALEFGLPTIAILGHGIARTYPAENEDLKRRILQSGGLVVSEYPPDEPPKPHYFIQRNRIVAGWAKATWIVEAGYKSGALNTARWAREMSRECFATPSFPGDPGYAGNQNLLDRAEATDFWSVESLGKAWLELSTARSSAALRESRALRMPSDENTLARKISELTARNGGAQVHELLDWAFSRAWSAEKFFSSLERVIRTGSVVDRQGVLVSADNH